MHPQPLRPRSRDRVLSALLPAISRAADRIFVPPRHPPAPQRIVVLKSCCLGDTLLATPLLSALRRAYPRAHIVAGIGHWSRPALLHNPDLDALLNLEDVGVGRPRPCAYARVVRRLRAGRFDLALVLDRTPLLTLLPLLAGIPIRAGIDSGGRGFPLNVRIPWTAVEHETRLFLRVGAALGIPTEGVGLRFVPTAVDESQATALLQENGIAGAAFIVFAPGGGRNPGMTLVEKRWPAQRFALLADRLHKEYGMATVLIGDQYDHEVTSSVRGLAHAPVVDLAGATNFGMLGALLARCRLFVGNDSGPMHLAVAVGAPVVAIFGPTDPAVYAHLGPRAIALRGTQSRSTDAVAVEDVLAACRRLL